MNANELLAAMDGATVNILQSPEANALVLRALSLLAAAEANDGTTPETDAAEIKVQLGSDYALTGNVPYADCARLERQRNGLAAEVLRLQVLLRNNVPWARIDA